MTTESNKILIDELNMILIESELIEPEYIRDLIEARIYELEGQNNDAVINKVHTDLHTKSMKSYVSSLNKLK